MSRRSSGVRCQLLLDLCTETDLVKLQQQYRKAEVAKRAYTKKTQGLINRDKREIQRLQDERERLLRSLRVSHSCNNQWSDANDIKDITAMLASEDRIDEELQAEKDKVASLKDQISKWEKKLKGQRTSGGTTRCSMKSENSNFQKRISLMESKLHSKCKCLNELMARNKELREELSALQLEKKKFLHVRSQLEKELLAIRKDFGNLMTKCTEALNASVKMQEKQRMLRNQNHKDVAHYNKDTSYLEQELSHYCHFEAFLDTKANVRDSEDIDSSRAEKSKQLESKELTLEEFEDAMKQILKESEESDLDKVIRNFIQMEEANYSLLNYINCQCNEVESIKRQISQLCSERASFVAEEQQQQEEQQALRMRLAIKQGATEQQLAVYQQRVEFMEKLIDQLKEGVESLLQISFGSSVICKQFGSSDRVQHENIKEYLRMVEDRVNELLTLKSYVHFQEKLNEWDIDSTIAGQLLGISPTAVSLDIAALTPAPDNDPDLVESVLLEAKEPVIRENLLKLVNKRIQQRKKAD